jgi:hypothetical protein
LDRFIDFIEKNARVIVWGFILAIIVVTVSYNVNFTKKYGKITIARILSIEPRRSGVETRIEILFHEKKYLAVIGCTCGSVGKFIFVKVRQDDPANYVVFYEDQPEVPDCISERPIPVDGWDDIPVCQD